jgi:hypothetical protein
LRGRRGIDDDAVDARTRYEHATLRVVAHDRQSFGYRDGAEAGRVKAVDFAANRRLGDRAREGLARCGAAARFDVVANAGNPRPRCLGMG